MKRSRIALLATSTLAISLGLATAGYAGIEIYQMNSNLGIEYLPRLDLTAQSKSLMPLSRPNVGDVIGFLSIPRIKKVIPIIEGTNAQELKKGVGHYIGSVLPGISDNSVLAGHRDSVFKNLGNVKLGDLLTVSTDYGTFVYKVKKIRIVEADDKTVIVPTDGAVLTLSTCYPFGYIGNAPKRYIVQADLLESEAIQPNLVDV